MPPGVGRDLEITIFQKIYEYAKAENKERVQKWCPPLSDFMKRFYKSGKNPLTGYEQDLDLRYCALQYALQKYHSRPCGDQDDSYWESLYSLFEVST